MKQVTFDRIKLGDDFFAEIEETKKNFGIWIGRKGDRFKYCVLDGPKDDGEFILNHEDFVAFINDNTEEFIKTFLKRYEVVKEQEDREMEYIKELQEKASRKSEEDE